MKKNFFAIFLFLLVGCSNNTETSLLEEKEELLISDEFLTDSAGERSLKINPEPKVWGYLGESGKQIFFDEQFARQKYLEYRAEVEESGISDPLKLTLGDVMEQLLQVNTLFVYTAVGDTVILEGPHLLEYRNSLVSRLRNGFR